MILRRFDNIYPRTFWIAVIEKEEDIYTILKNLQYTTYCQVLIKYEKKLKKKC